MTTGPNEKMRFLVVWMSSLADRAHALGDKRIVSRK